MEVIITYQFTFFSCACSSSYYSPFFMLRSRFSVSFTFLYNASKNTLYSKEPVNVPAFKFPFYFLEGGKRSIIWQSQIGKSHGRAVVLQRYAASAVRKTFFNRFIKFSFKKIVITETVYSSIVSTTHVTLHWGSLYSLRNVSPKIRKRGYFHRSRFLPFSSSRPRPMFSSLQ